jgi:Fur family ferric uptake transcriptional regulator
MPGSTTAARLRGAGERVTPQRLSVAESLASAGRQLTAEELWERVRRQEPGIGRATVFRTLDALVAAGAARRLEADSHVYSYVACQPEHHHHLACRSCGRVDEIGERLVRPFMERLAAETGFAIDDARLDFYGTCAGCAADATPARSPGG